MKKENKENLTDGRCKKKKLIVAVIKMRKSHPPRHLFRGRKSGFDEPELKLVS